MAVKLRGQWADTNLTSSEKFSLGGNDAVRAYPTGEAPGDRGWLATAELRYAFTSRTDGEPLLHRSPVQGALWSARDYAFAPCSRKRQPVRCRINPCKENPAAAGSAE
jgi:hypothetical protein